MGLHFDRPSKATLRGRAEVVAPMVNAGLPGAEIARRTGISAQWISAWMKRQRPTPIPQELNMRSREAHARAVLEVRRMSAMKAYQAGTSQAEIARQFHVTRATVLRWVRRFRIGGTAALQRAARMGRPPEQRATK